VPTQVGVIAGGGIIVFEEDTANPSTANVEWQNKNGAVERGGSGRTGFIEVKNLVKGGEGDKERVTTELKKKEAQQRGGVKHGRVRG